MIFEGNIFCPDKIFRYGNVETNGDVITKVTITKDCKQGNKYIIPGLIDVHLHGAAGFDICDGTTEAIEAIASFQRSKGVVGFVGATMTLPVEDIEAILDNASKACDRNIGMLGICLEGPFISPNKKGAQKLEHILRPSVELMNQLQKKANGHMKYVVAAPEECRLEGGFQEFVDGATNMGLKVCIGHSDATYDVAMDAFEAGACEVTHLFNAMSSFDKRSPGVVGAAFDADAYVELIADGNHVHPSMVRMVFNGFADDKVILISDSMMATGMEDGEYRLGGQKVNVRGNKATLDSGTLAGSVTNLYDCMMNVINMGVPIENAVLAATLNPAKSLGVDDFYGKISEGYDGHLLAIEV
ncbi:MAG: N-acetylglucosamine-6-phosphate deacetylase [Lachnospiraceae bacterium]|nr:N-acetylglucosamine-6-phosphate deacetylase [Lachnospiraceae bacterium]